MITSVPVNDAEILRRHAEPGTEYPMEIGIVVEAGRLRYLLQGHWTENNPFPGHIQPYVKRVLHDAFAKRFFEEMNPP